LFAVFASSKYPLVNRALNTLLMSCSCSLLKTKESVVLYVAHDNKAAAKVYHRVGFIGLDGKDCSVDGVERWLEIGFDRDVVKLGHW
jgi:hypothetical protein